MALPITITDAGRAEIINAQNTGTGPVTITEIGFGTGQYTPLKTRTALQAQVKRVGSVAGQAVAADTIHVMAVDEGASSYNVGEFGLFSDKGTLIAVYSQPAASGWIIQKAGPSTLLLATDIILESLDATSITFGDISFINPPATTTVQGVVELATPEETQAGTDARRVVTPAGLKSLTGTTSRAGLVQLNNTLTSTSTAVALTAAQGKKLQDEKQPLDATLSALASLVTAANQLIYSTGADTFEMAALTAFARTLLDDSDAVKARETLGLVKQTSANDASSGSVLTVGAFGLGSQVSPGISDANLATIGGSYQLPSGAVNKPDTVAAGWLLDVVAYSPSFTWQRASRPASGGVVAFSRWQDGAGSWTPWIQDYTTGNVSQFIQTLLDDTDAATARATLGAQASDATLSALAGLATAANQLIYSTGSDQFAMATLSAFARTLLDDVDAAAARETLGLVKQTSVTDTTSGSVLTVGAFGLGSQTSSAISDANSATVGGSYVLSSNAANRPDAAVSAGWSLDVVAYSPSFTWQRASRPASGGAVAFSRWQNGAAGWTPWIQDYTTGNVSPFIQTLLDDADAATARVTLGVSDIPAGAIAHFAHSSPPTGWLKANGATVGRTAYAALFAAIGTAFGAGNGSTTFNLPDLRGEFIRGLDDSRGVDAGRLLGSSQKGTVITGDNGVAPQVQGIANLADANVDPSDGVVRGIYHVNSVSETADSNTYWGTVRPRNIAMLACIKY